jgi:hypothetical protein
LSVETEHQTGGLRFHDLKPHLSGSIWHLNGALGTWSDTLFTYTRVFCDVIRQKMPSLVTLLAGGRDSANPEWDYLEPVFCRQRVVGEAAASEQLIVPLGEVTAETLADNPEAITVFGAVYRTTAAPAWLKDIRDFPQYEARRWDLIQIAFSWPYVLVSASGAATHDSIVSALNDWLREETSDYWIEPVSAELLDAAFIGEETSRTSLLGLHRRTRSKADRKTLSGLDLRYALDPIADQTYAFSSGRAKIRLDALSQDLKGIEITKLIAEAFPAKPSRRVAASQGRASAHGPNGAPSLGYGRAGRSITVGSTPGIVDFARRLDLIRLLLQVTEVRLRKSKPGETLFNDPVGLSYLANPVSLTELPDVSEPFEAQFSVLRYDEAGPSNLALRDIIEDWERNGSLRPGPVQLDSFGAFSVPLTVYWQGDELATVMLIVSRNDDRLECQAKVLGAREDASTVAALRLVDRMLDLGGANPIDLHFESGHVLADGSLYRPALREVLFENWRWLPSSAGGREYLVSLEKPSTWRFGQTPQPVKTIEDSCSLFSRIVRHPCEVFHVSETSQSWVLLCHDQPEEIADFIFVDAAEDQRRLELLHVKSASGAAERGLAVGPYEKVVPQAIKNLRHLDPKLLVKRFTDARSKGLNRGIFCVYVANGQIMIDTTTDPFHDRLAALAAFGPPRRSKVVCYTPHVPQILWEEQVRLRARDAAAPSRAAYMLSMLLLNARSACTGFNSEFEVWSDASAV